MLIDLHNHTSHFSACSVLEAETLVRTALNRGLDGLAITEHDIRFDDRALDGLRKLAGPSLRLFSGIEHTAGHFHILSFGEHLPTGPWPDPDSLLEAAEGRETALVLAHPWRWGATDIFPDDDALEDFLRRFHAVEVMSANLDDRAQELGLDFCAARGIPVCGGSDAHSPEMSATYATRFSNGITDEIGLARALKAGDCTPVRL